MRTYEDVLCPEKAFIWRITHRDNLAWILDNGVHCASSGVRDPDFISIGNAELITKRSTHAVPIPPGGNLSDYVPFYFTPFSPMLLNIKSGRSGVIARNNDEIVILVADLHSLAREQHPFVFTNGHAYMQLTEYFADLDRLASIDWVILQHRDFKSDPNDPRKMERYQAEALVHRHLPVQRLRGIVCASEAVKSSIEPLLVARNSQLSVLVRPAWYF
jgi:hypothetical protein